jgi:hypothetical protein
MLGFRGHFVTKSRGYSTNLGTLRADRAAFRAQQYDPAEPVDDDDSTPVLASWQYLASGTSTPATRSWRPASSPPCELPVRRC